MDIRRKALNLKCVLCLPLLLLVVEEFYLPVSFFRLECICIFSVRRNRNEEIKEIVYRFSNVALIIYADVHYFCLFRLIRELIGFFKDRSGEFASFPEVVETDIFTTIHVRKGE